MRHIGQIVAGAVVMTFGTAEIVGEWCHHHTHQLTQACFQTPEHTHSTGDSNDSERFFVLRSTTPVASGHLTSST